MDSSHCFHDPWFEITCNKSVPVPFLTKLNIQVLEIRFSQQSLSVNIWPQQTPTCPEYNFTTRYNLIINGSPFHYSTSDNMFVTRGCPAVALFRNEIALDTLAVCATACSANDSLRLESSSDYCTGIECCQTPIPNLLHPLRGFTTLVVSTNMNATSNTHCFTGVVMESASVNKFPKYSSRLIMYPTVLQYSFDVKDLKLSPNATCQKTATGEGCQCNSTYRGNPYLENGCQLDEVCRTCQGVCRGREGDSYYCDLSSTRTDHEPIIGVSAGAGLIILVPFCYWLYRVIRRRRELNRRAKNFKRNGGLLLQQQLVTNKRALEGAKIFSVDELEKVTDNFNRDRILGQGGQGTVYKGMLTDGQIVAIKKSKIADESQLVQFVNELVILSQINHRNVVKLLGCCLETEVPLLVYEFISNGTLAQRIHDPDEEEDFFVSWKMRLKIAADSAGAIAYLHSSSSTPVYHRDIKTSNILLDEKNRAKVSDFGTSKTIEIDQTHTTTAVRGTMGYLDPEYFRTHQFTEKSDVYSVGVVLLELLTSRKPLVRISFMEHRTLVTEFFYVMDHSRIIDILDPRVVEQAKYEDLESMAELARKCLNLNRTLRPTMREVAMALETIIKSSDKQPVVRRVEEAVVEHEVRKGKSMNDATSTYTKYPRGVGPSSHSFSLLSLTLERDQLSK